MTNASVWLCRSRRRPVGNAAHVDGDRTCHLHALILAERVRRIGVQHLQELRACCVVPLERRQAIQEVLYLRRTGRIKADMITEHITLVLNKLDGSAVVTQHL